MAITVMETNGRECNYVRAIKDSHEDLKNLFRLLGLHVHTIIEPVITRSNRASKDITRNCLNLPQLVGQLE